MNFDPRVYRRWSARELAAEYIREKIFARRYPVGARTPQEEVATELGISRVPVREALVSLEVEGYLSMTRNKSASVRVITSDDIRDQFELQGYAIGLAASRAASSDNRVLVSSLGRIQAELHDATGPDQVHDLVGRFSQALCAAGGSARQRAALARFGNVVLGSFCARVPGSIDAARDMVIHQLRAQEARSASRALAAAVAGHVRHGDLLVELMRRDGELSPSS